MAEEDSDAEVKFDVALLRFTIMGRLSFDFNIYGTSLGKCASFSLDESKIRLGKTDRNGKPTASSQSWRLRQIKSAQVVRNPWWLYRTFDPSRYRVGLLLEMQEGLGDSGTSLLLFSDQFDSLLDALEARIVVVQRTLRKIGVFSHRTKATS